MSKRYGPKYVPSILIAAAIGSIVWVNAGNLTPPPGSVAPTMKTLDEVHPGTPINSLAGASNAVHVINQAGHYFLTGHVTGQPGKHGILVTASGRVSISSSGFSLIGTPGSLDGIRMTNPTPGSFASLDATGNLMDSNRLVIAGWGGDGVHTENLSEVHLAGVTVRSCGGSGLSHVNPELVDIEGLSVSDAGSHGLSVSRDLNLQPLGGNILIHGKSSLQRTGGDGVHIENQTSALLEGVTVSEAGGDGMQILNVSSTQINGDAVSLCTGNGLKVYNPALSYEIGDTVIYNNCIVRSVGGDGVYLADTSSAQLNDVSVSSATVNGIHVINTPVHGDNCSSKGNGGRGYLLEKFQNGDVPTQDDFADLIDSMAVGNTNDGFSIANMPVKLTGCVSNGNGGNGYNVLKTFFETGDKPTQSQFADSSASRNAGNGFDLADVSATFAGGSSTNNGGDGLRHRINELETILKNLGILAFTASNNGGHGVSTEGCDLNASGLRSSNNGGAGVDCKNANIAAVLNGSVVIGNLNSSSAGGGGGGGGGAVFADCGSVRIEDSTFSKNTGKGIGINETIPDTKLHVSRTTCDTNTEVGLDVVMGSSGSIVVEDSGTSGNGQDGMRFGIGAQSPSSPLGIKCSGHTSSGNGVYITGGSSSSAGWSLGHIHDNSVSRNGGFGIYCDAGFASGVLERNTCTGNHGGLKVEGTGNLVVSNSSTSDAAGGISVVMPGNTVGPTIDEADIATSCNPRANVLH